MSVRIPLGNHTTGLNLVTFLDGNNRTIGELVALTLTTKLVGNCQLTGTGNRNQCAVCALYVLQVMQANGTAVFNLDAVRSRGPARRTTNVERTHGQLGTRLTNRLGSDNTHSFTDIDQVATRQITTVTSSTHTVVGVTSDRRAHDNFVNAVLLEELNPLLIDQGTSGHDGFFAAGLDDITSNHTTQNALTQRLNNIATFNVRRHQQAVVGAAIRLGNNQILSNINQTTSQVTGVSCLQSRVGQTLTSTVSRDEVLKYVQTFTEVRSDRRFNNRAVWLGHQTTHTRQLTNLRSGTTSTGVGHHIHGIEGLLINFLAVAVKHASRLQVVHHRLGNLIVGLGPQIDNLVVLLALGNQTGSILIFNFLNFVGRFINDARLLVWNDEVVYTNGCTGNSRVSKTGIHQLVSEDDGLFQADHAIALVDQLGNRLLLQRLVDHLVGQALRQDLEQQCTTNSGINDTCLGGPAFVFVLNGFGDTHLNQRVQLNLATAIRHLNFIDVGKTHAFALRIDTRTSHVIQTQYHVLRRYDDRFTGCGRQDVVGRHHQCASFQLSLKGQRNVYGHLVAVKVGVIGSTNQRVQLNRLTFNQNRFKRLDTQTVKCRCAVQQYGVLADNLSKDVPHFRQLALDHFLGGFDSRCQTTMLQLAKNERLE